MKSKSIDQMNLEELRQQLAVYEKRSDHVALLMMAHIQEAIAVRTKEKNHENA